MLYKSQKGYELELIEKSNIVIFGEIAKAKLITPKPPIYVDDDGKEMETHFILYIMMR